MDFLDHPRTFVFISELGEVQEFMAYTLDGAYNIAKRLFRSEPYQLCSIDGEPPR